MLNKIPHDYCRKCQRGKNFPRYSCRTCSVAYTSNFKLAKEFNYKYQKRVRRSQSDSRLTTLYQRIKEKYFDGEYVPEARLVTLEWKRSHRLNGCCWKSKKLIKIGGLYRFAFIRKTNSTSGMAVTSEFNSARRRGLIDTMIHEMLHLRLAHHKKSFKRKEAELKAKVKDSEVEELYQGLITE